MLRCRMTVLPAALLLAVVAPARAQARSADATVSPPAAAGPAAGLGRIAGRITEKGDAPVEYAQVSVDEIRRGVTADEHGRFVIEGVPAGTVHVRILSPSRDPVVRTVVVRPGTTAMLDVVLGPQSRIQELPEIEVHGRKRIDTATSGTSHGFSGEDLAALPVDRLVDALATKPGVVIQNGEIRVRGGRAGEVPVRVNGIEAMDPQFRNNSTVATPAVAGVELLSGGVDAEFGGGLSGLINVTTREGGPRLAGRVRWDTDRFGDATKTFDNFDRFSVGFGGPTPIENLTYFATYEGTFQDTYLKTSMAQPRRTLLDFIQLGNRQSNQVNTNLKLAYQATPSQKLTIESIRNRSITTPYNHMWSRRGFVSVTWDTTRVEGQPDVRTPRYGSWSSTPEDSTYVAMNMPDHVPTTDSRFQSIAGVWTNQLSSTSVWTTRASFQSFDTRLSVGRSAPWEYDTQSPFYWSGNLAPGTENNPYFATHGDLPFWAHRGSTILAAKTDLSSNRWARHTVKTGAEVRYSRVANLGLVLPNNETDGLPGASRSDYVNYSPEGSAYVQDRWQFEGLVLNAGVRYDVFSPGDQISDADLKSGRRYKQQFSPRLGVAYPISDRDALSFHYGWTYQTPARNFVFENRGVGSSVNTKGNPDLEPETNIAYQAGMQHLFTKDVSGQFAVFFRDIFGLVTTRQERDAFGELVNVFANGDYASARGFETSITKSFSHKLSAELNYTFALATGVASNPNDALQFFNGGQLYLPISEQPLEWDQRHTISLSANVRDPDRWGFRLLWTYGSGFPFTPKFREDRRPDPRLKNSRRMPSTATLTIDGDKFYRIWGQSVTMFFDARNVLDQKNIANLSISPFPNPNIFTGGNDDYAIYYTETGRAGGAYLKDLNGDGTADWVPVRDPSVFAEGRNVRVGVSVAF